MAGVESRRNVSQIYGREREHRGVLRLYGHGLFAVGQRELEAVPVRLHLLHPGCLEIRVVTGRLEARATELGGDEFGGDLEAGRWSGPALKQIRGEKRDVAPKGFSGYVIQCGLNRRRYLGENGTCREGGEQDRSP